VTGSSRSISQPNGEGALSAAGRWIPGRLDLALLAAPLVCAGCLVCRWQPFDAPPLIAAAALSPVVVVPAALATLAAGILRRPRTALAGLACVLAACAVLVAHRPAAQPGGPATVITVATANLYFRNPVPGNALEAVLSRRPDLIAFQEVSPEVADRLRADAPPAGYRWAVLRPRWGSTGLAVLSRHPVVDEQLLSVGRQPFLRVDVDVNGTMVSLLNVHIEAPVSRAAAARWRAQLGAVREIIGSLPPRPIVVAGDFNATVDHRPFRRLLSPALRDVAQQRGSRWLATWPVGRTGIPPLIQLDHVLLSSELSTTALDAWDVPGSDHKLLVTSVGVPPAAATDRWVRRRSGAPPAALPDHRTRRPDPSPACASSPRG
jgi:endonuclease/exonuclease/phosphatase (EEP) superfamily protein YafD